MLGFSAGCSVVDGAILGGLGLLVGRGLRRRRRDLFYLTGLRNGQIALAVGRYSVKDLAVIEKMLSPGGHLVEIIPEGIEPAPDPNIHGVRLTSGLVCEPSSLPFRPATFDAIVLVDWEWVEVLISLLKPSGVLSLAQNAGRGFSPVATRRRQLSDAGLEVIDSPGVSLSYVVNARRPINSEAAR